MSDMFAMLQSWELFSSCPLDSFKQLQSGDLQVPISFIMDILERTRSLCQTQTIFLVIVPGHVYGVESNSE